MDNQQPSALPPLPPLPELPAEHKDDAAAASPQKAASAINELKTPPPPPPPIAMRSLQSDLKSLESSGGVAPKAETVKLDDLTPAIPGAVAPEASADEPGRTGMGRSIFGALLGFMLVVGVGAAGYFWIYPTLFGEGNQPDVVASPPSGNVATLAPQPIVHRSLFTKLPTLTGTIAVQRVTQGGLTQALQQEAANQAPAKSIKELAFTDGDGAPLRFGETIVALLPGLNKGDIQNTVEDDFTGFLYYNEKGVWPGYVAKLKSTAVPADVQAAFAGLEGLDVAALYLKDPGVGENFQTGPFRGAPIRYRVFAASGASFNYGTVGDYMLIATSFDAFKSAVDLLGL